jgi:proline racemase
MRIVVEGAPDLGPGSMLERSRRFAAGHDDVRTLLVDEPRGHAAMCAAVLAPPAEAAAHAGVVFLEPLGVVHMCGHGAMAVATMLVEHGRVPAREPVTEVVLDTAAGLVTARVAVARGRVTAVTIRNVPSYAVALDARVEVDGLGPVAFDLAYGGHFYAIVEAAPLGLDLVPAAAPRLVDAGERIRAAVERAVDLVHPEGEQARGLLYVQLAGPARGAGAHGRNAVVVAPGGLDRSPCGTGTSARVAGLHARGRLAPGEAFVHESILGTRFEARIVGLTRVGPYEAVVPEVTGRAWLTGRGELVVSEGDPFPAGFRL